MTLPISRPAAVSGRARFWIAFAAALTAPIYARPIRFAVAAGILFGACAASAATHPAKSPELADVQQALNAAAEGDIVVVPSGTATWKSTLTVTKNIKLEGAGIAKTIILDGLSGQGKNGRSRRSGGSLMKVELSKDSPMFRLTGFEFRGSPSGTGAKHVLLKLKGGSDSREHPLVAGCTSNFRLDHCKFDNVNGLAAVFTNLLGVVDHIEYIGKGDFCFVQHPNWGGAELGHGSWADDPYWGSNKFLFFEDCDFTNLWQKKVPYGFDAYLGARYVVRHCRFHGNTAITGHGTETPQRGTKQIEIYSNSFDFPASEQVKFPHLRSGSVLFHDNRLSNCFAGMGLHAYRQWTYDPDWGYSNGMNKWDENDTDRVPVAAGVNTAPMTTAVGANITDSQSTVGGAKNWKPGQFSGISEGVTYVIKNVSQLNKQGHPRQTFLTDNGTNSLKMGHVPIKFEVGDRYEIWKVKTSLDQPGQGKGRLLTGNVRYGGVTFASDGSAGSWPQRGYPREPCYSWNNVNLSGGAGTNVQIELSSNQHSIKDGRDYVNYGNVGDTPQKIGPIGNTYTCTPFTYPHPLQNQSSALNAPPVPFASSAREQNLPLRKTQTLPR